MTDNNTITSGNDGMIARYRNAQALMNGFSNQQLVQNDTIFPVWIGDSSSFWYERTLKLSSGQPVTLGKEYRLVDAAAQSNTLAFDHQQLANALAESVGETVDPQQLPLSDVIIELAPLRIEFSAFEQRWRFNGESGGCETITSTILSPVEVLSPDGSRIAFLRDYNLWVRDVATGEERALTRDGTDEHIYCAANTVWGTTLRRLTTPAAQWSPDGTRLLTVRRDTRGVKTLPMIDYVPKDGSLRPQLSEARVAYPGDEQIETWLPVCVEVATGAICSADYPPIPAGHSAYFNFFDNLLTWAKDSRSAYFISQSRGDRSTECVRFDVTDGSTQVLFQETSETHINIVPDSNVFPLHRFLRESNELLWWSERSGWGHLYLYDLDSGELKRTLTGGEWYVHNVLRIDRERREVWLQTNGRTAGRDPYYRDICRVSLETGELTPVLEGDEEWVVQHSGCGVILQGQISVAATAPYHGISPDGQYLVATHSRVDRPAASLLFDRAGRELMPLEQADVSTLPADWQWPEPFRVKAADGETDLYGVMLKPPGFSSENSYPVINFIHGAPWIVAAPKASFHSSGVYADRHFYFGAALASLGFVVILLDSRGGPWRGRQFMDYSYGWIADSASREDHLGALEQLLERHPFMDRERMGVYGTGYRSSLQHFLECQDVYKVCVQMSLLDNRLIGTFENDMWQGIEGPSVERKHPEELVEGLQGKLMLMHALTSVLSPAYPAAGMLRVVEALQKANKDFDMLLVPQGDFACTPYMYRRGFDYLVKHLLGEEPPKAFDMGSVNMSGS